MFKTNDVVSYRIVKTLIIKYSMYTKIFAEKNVSSFCICKSYSHFFFSKNTYELDIVLTTSVNITKTCLYYFDPLKPHFYIVKLGFTGVYIIFLISAQNIDCVYLLEPPRRGGSNEYPQSMFWAEIRKNIRIFYLKIFIFGW